MNAEDKKKVWVGTKNQGSSSQSLISRCSPHKVGVFCFQQTTRRPAATHESSWRTMAAAVLNDGVTGARGVPNWCLIMGLCSGLGLSVFLSAEYLHNWELF